MRFTERYGIDAFERQRKALLINYIILIFFLGGGIALVTRSLYTIIFALIVIVISGGYRIFNSISTYIYEVVHEDTLMIRYIRWGRKKEMRISDLNRMKYKKHFSINRARIPYLYISDLNGKSIRQFEIGDWNENRMDEFIRHLKAHVTTEL